MTTTVVTTACACSGKTCAWISHALLGQCCANYFEGPKLPTSWVIRSGVGPFCPSCVAIDRLRDAGPLQPIRWSKRRIGYLVT